MVCANVSQYKRTCVYSASDIAYKKAPKVRIFFFFLMGEFLTGLVTLFAFSCERESSFYLLLFARRFGSPRNLNVTHGCARGFTLHVSPVPCLAHINIPVSLSHE